MKKKNNRKYSRKRLKSGRKYLRKSVRKSSRKYPRKSLKKSLRKSIKRIKRIKRTKKRQNKRYNKKIIRGGNFKKLLLKFIGEEWYGETNLTKFLEVNFDSAAKAEARNDKKEKLSSFKEIIIAGFTDCMRDGINGIISYMNQRADELKNGRNWTWIVVAAGGDGFNRLLSEPDSRPISPDIDVKVTFDLTGIPDNKSTLEIYKRTLEIYNRYLIVSTEVLSLIHI